MLRRVDPRLQESPGQERPGNRLPPGQSLGGKLLDSLGADFKIGDSPVLSYKRIGSSSSRVASREVDVVRRTLCPWIVRSSVSKFADLNVRD